MTINERCKARFDRQVSKGLAKYGTTLDNNPAHIIERLEHLAEELTDGLQYIEWIKDELIKVHCIHRMEIYACDIYCEKCDTYKCCRDCKEQCKIACKMGV